MQASIIHKIPQGKLVRLTLEYDTMALRTIQINGDFFVHPEETILEMEKALIRLPVEAKPERVKQLLDEIVENHHAELVGVDTESLANLICGRINQ